MNCRFVVALLGGTALVAATGALIATASWSMRERGASPPPTIRGA